MQTIYIAAVFISAILAIVGVLHAQFDDNVIQRLGLSMVGFAACVELWLMFKESDCCALANSRNLFVIGCAIYGMGTALKVIKHRDRT